MASSSAALRSPARSAASGEGAASPDGRASPAARSARAARRPAERRRLRASLATIASSLGRFRAGEPLRPWLLTIVANEARNRRRSAGRRTALALRVEPPRDDDVSVEATVLATESRTALLGALADLREDDRLVLGCRYLLELTEAETAATLGVPQGTVKSRTSRALGRLRGEVTP